ncbi:Hsp70 family protein [Nocardia stercoris]|uniref:Hsp70 family protein n=1 Tax=Nocardia stercoris TaxID=2483361 RepID=A0A3M2KXD4_9NOCA|nr:Hsp70 family protein [Nocardia stercoris]RMI29110.1 Hsp70 family protein [Nocardia stercoris]
MTRTTVDFGIDLGTTNSAVAVLRGVEAEVIKNNEDADTTPSAVWIDKRDKLRVGRAAKERSESDPDNTAAEFKLRMGTAQETVRFAASGRELTPPQLSAEVLKSLRADVAQRLGEDIEAAVVTVPAAFDMSSCEATRAAAEAAGLRFAPLLQEPTAAALAYGYQAADENARWLVYDLGGGTFDAAVIQLRDGEFTVLNHRGDNYLGGKLIDWRIVEELLIPAVRTEFGLPDLARGSARWRPVVNKLKLHAEKAKIALSRGNSADIEIDLDDGTGRHRFEFYYELQRADVERLAEPLLTRSVNLCRKAIEEAHLGSGDIAKLILVGGPTLSPYLREHLTDPERGLGIPLDFSQDPMTVVARGAAIFAGTQRIPGGSAPVAVAGGFTVQLEYPPVGPDREPLVIGVIAGADGTVPAGLNVELVNSAARPPWRSGKVPVGENGAFQTYLFAETGTANTFEIELTDATGTRRELSPNTLSYTVGAVETQPPLIHSLSVGLADNSTVKLIERGAPLPARARKRLRTAAAVHRGGRTGLIRIPVLEGEHARADRNRIIGRLDITADQIERSVPEGSEIEVTLEIDASRMMVARAYLPYLDTEFENVVDLRTESLPDPAELRRETDLELQRLADVRARHKSVGNPTSELLLMRIDDEQTVTDVQQLVDAAASDPDAAVAAAQRLRDLRAAIDEAEDELMWPSLVVRAQEMLGYVRRAVDDVGDDIYRRQYDQLDVSVREAIDSRAPDLLRQRTGELNSLWRRVLDHTGELQVIIFERLARDRNEMLDLHQADELIEEGRTAVRAGEINRLRMINTRLRALFAEPPAEPDPFSTIRSA